ncbi:SDR family oxidoreductase [Synechococcus sp. LTW-R]|nr:SDR family oxidoreductase [Synechococcus sp. LTW-R]
MSSDLFSRSVSDLISLEGRVALVTGGAGKIGSVISSALSELGARIVLVDINADNLLSVKKSLEEKFNRPVLTVDFDLEKRDDFKYISNLIEEETGRLDVLVNNAAFVGTSNLSGWSVPFPQQTLNAWQRAMDVNLRAPFALTQACLKLLHSNNSSVINISSIYGICGPDLSLYEDTSMNNPAAYAASKGGLLQLTRWMSTTLAPTIRVNAISPGGIYRNQPSSFVNRYIEKTPMKRMGKEEDLIGAIVYLATDMSGWVTGQNIIVDGGWSTW